MHVEITRMLTGWLSHAEYGVNKLLPGIPRLNLADKADTKPAAVKIYNDVDFDIAGVSGIDPPEVPSLVIVSDIDLRNTDVSQQKRSAHGLSAVAGIGYYAEQGESKARNVRDGNYVLRAVMRSLNLYQESPERSKDFRELNEIRIATITNVTVQRTAGGIQGKLVGFVLADLLVMDKAP